MTGSSLSGCLTRPWSAVLGASLLLALAGCSGSTADSPPVATVTVTAPTPTSAPPDTVPSPVTTVTVPAPVTAPARGEPSARQGSGGIVVPNVVGSNHQLAQDTMQAAGLYNLSEEDATGQGRLLLFDRNWVVVSQRPAGGARVGEDTTIVLTSKKYGE